MVTIEKQLRTGIKKDIKNALEESPDLEPEETTCKIFSKEEKYGTHKLLFLSKDELHKISRRAANVDAAHLSPSNAGTIMQLLHYQKHFEDQELHHNDGPFRRMSICLHYFNAFRAHDDDIDALMHE